MEADMSDEFTMAGKSEESAADQVTNALKSVSQHVSDAIETSRQPGMPLDVLTRAVREAPLAALGIAFLLGVVFARPRRSR